MNKLLFLLLLLLPLSLIGQVESQFNGTLNVFSGSRIGSTNTFTISGIFNSTTTSYTSSQSDTGDIVQVQSGARFYWLHIYSIASNSGGVITCNVRDSSSTLTTFPLGKWSIFRPTPNLRLPLSPDGETNASRSSTFNTLALRVDEIQTSVASATNCEQTLTKNNHGFRKWTPIYWTGSTYVRPPYDSLVPDYIVVDSLTANTFKVANCGTYTTSLTNGLYWFTSASPGYSLTADTTKVPLFQALNGKLILNPIVGFNLMSGGGSGDVTRDELADSTAAIRADFPNGIISALPLGDVTIAGATSSDLRIQNTRTQLDGKFKVGADSSFVHDPAQDTTFQKGTTVFGKASSLGSPTVSGYPFIFRNPSSSSTYVLIESGRTSPTGGAAGIRLLPSGNFTSIIEYGTSTGSALQFSDKGSSKINFQIGSSQFVTGNRRTVIVGSDDPTQWAGNAALVVYDTITSGKALAVFKKAVSSSTPIATFSSASNDRMTVEDDGDVKIGTGAALAKLHVVGDCIIESTLWLNVAKTVGIFSGTGTPEGAVTASVGSTFHRTNGGALTSYYVKESGSGDTGWVAK